MNAHLTGARRKGQIDHGNPGSSSQQLSTSDEGDARRNTLERIQVVGTGGTRQHELVGTEIAIMDEEADTCSRTVRDHGDVSTKAVDTGMRMYLQYIREIVRKGDTGSPT